jgi:hypothetical protein
MKYCEACHHVIEEYELPGGRVITTRPHEIRSRGTGGKCVPENQFQLCKTCHTKWHNIGWYQFIRQYDHLKKKAWAIHGRPWHEEIKEDDTPQVFI